MNLQEPTFSVKHDICGDCAEKATRYYLETYRINGNDGQIIRTRCDKAKCRKSIFTENQLLISEITKEEVEMLLVMKL